MFRNPNKDTRNELVDHEMLPNWPDFTDKQKQYLELSEHPVTGRGLRSKECAFWMEYLPQLLSTGRINMYNKRVLF